MKKKRSKILSSILIISVVLSILLVVYIVPCSAATYEKGDYHYDGKYFSNGNNYVGLPFDLYVGGLRYEQYDVTAKVSNFGGLSYNDEMSGGYGNKFSNIYWTNSNGLGYNPNYKIVSPRLIEAISSNTEQWWNGITDYEVMCTVFSDVYYRALDQYTSGQMSYVELGDYLRTYMNVGGSLGYSTYPTFLTYCLSYDGLINVDLLRILDGLINYDFLPQYIQLQHYVNEGLSEIVLETDEDDVTRAEYRYADSFYDDAEYVFTVNYTGIRKDSSLNLVEVSDTYSHKVYLNRYEVNLGGFGYPCGYDYVTNEGIIGNIDILLNDVLNDNPPFNSSGGEDYHISEVNVVFDLWSLMHGFAVRELENYAYITDVEISILPSWDNRTCWNSSGFHTNTTHWVPLTELRVSYNNATNDSVDKASVGFNEYVGGVINEQVFIDSSNFNLLDWLGNTLGSVMNTDIIGNVSIGDILSVALGCGFVILVLKFFSGG